MVSAACHLLLVLAHCQKLCDTASFECLVNSIVSTMQCSHTHRVQLSGTFWP